MHRCDDVHARPNRTSHVVFAAVILVALLTGCGGDADEPEGVESTRADTEVDAAGDLVGAGAGDADIAASGSERPDWLPVWLFLPPDLEITLDLHDAGTGKSVVTGWIGDGDLQQLYDDALFMTQSGGYIIAGEPGDGDIGSFNADHTSDGSTVWFGVTEQNDGIVLWSMEFSGI